MMEDLNNASHWQHQSKPSTVLVHLDVDVKARLQNVVVASNALKKQ